MAKDADKELSVAQTETKKEEPKDAKKDAKKDKKDAKPAKKDDKKKDAKAEKKEEPKDEIPMDAAAIKAYSSVIADAAEDSEPQTPVQYSAVIPDEEKKAPVQSLSQDPMGSMIQNEISEIKDASIKASKENEWKSNEC